MFAFAIYTAHAQYTLVTRRLALVRLSELREVAPKHARLEPVKQDQDTVAERHLQCGREEMQPSAHDRGPLHRPARARLLGDVNGAPQEVRKPARQAQRQQVAGVQLGKR